MRVIEAFAVVVSVRKWSTCTWGWAMERMDTVSVVRDPSAVAATIWSPSLSASRRERVPLARVHIAQLGKHTSSCGEEASCGGEGEADGAGGEGEADGGGEGEADGGGDGEADGGREGGFDCALQTGAEPAYAAEPACVLNNIYPR